MEDFGHIWKLRVLLSALHFNIFFYKFYCIFWNKFIILALQIFVSRWPKDSFLSK